MEIKPSLQAMMSIARQLAALTEQVNAMIELQKNEGDSIGRFFNTKLELKPEFMTPLSVIFAEYLIYCAENRVASESERKLSARLWTIAEKRRVAAGIMVKGARIRPNIAEVPVLEDNIADVKQE